MSKTKIHKDFVYGIDVYYLSTDNKIPYQLSFERDVYLDRINVILLPLVMPDKWCSDLREMVCDCFIDYLKNNINEVIYFETDISTRDGELRMIKFLRWIEKYKEMYDVSFILTDTDNIKYMEVYIKNKIKANY